MSLANMDKDCEQWLIKHLPDCMQMFVANEFVSTDGLSQVDDNDLKDMGIQALGKRREIMAKINLLKQRKDTTQTLPCSTDHKTVGKPVFIYQRSK